MSDPVIPGKHWYHAYIPHPVKPGDLVYTNTLALLGAHAHFEIFEVTRVTDKSIMVLPRERDVLGTVWDEHQTRYTRVRAGPSTSMRPQRLKLKDRHISTYEHMQPDEVLTEESVAM